VGLAPVNARDETMYPSVRAAADAGPVDLVMARSTRYD
jgi:hypothetical protein